jgi:hypothetical protein
VFFALCATSNHAERSIQEPYNLRLAEHSEGCAELGL